MLKAEDGEEKDEDGDDEDGEEEMSSDKISFEDFKVGSLLVIIERSTFLSALTMTLPIKYFLRVSRLQSHIKGLSFKFKMVSWENELEEVEAGALRLEDVDWIGAGTNDSWMVDKLLPLKLMTSNDFMLVAEDGSLDDDEESSDWRTDEDGDNCDEEDGKMVTNWFLDKSRIFRLTFSPNVDNLIDCFFKREKEES